MTDDLHPLVADWFAERFGEPTDPQVAGWPLVRAGRDVLISAPTGSGKTLAAFTIALDGLVRRAADGMLEERPIVLYVSPLKALTNDVRKNLDVPLAELRERARAAGLDLATIRTATRTGDTPAAERAKMLRTPPHVLVTTPESLFILLTAEKSRALLTRVETIILDEIHAIAGDKRGAHLALTLARLEALVVAETGRRPQRIGLSATVKPLETVARFLGDATEIVDVGSRRAMTIAVEVPKTDELGPIASREAWDDIYDRVAELASAHRTTLVFVGTRRMSERVAFALGKRLGPGTVLPHHGSLAREIRLTTENALKAGELRVVVATASLELGIDIGSVDLVVQLGSPRAIATALQRIGRSGHWVGAKPEGRIFATTRDELLECAALAHAIGGGAIDALRVPRAPLDILAQQIVAAAAAGEWRLDDLYATARTAYPYRDLARKDFDDVVTMLADGVATSRGRSGAFLHVDRVNGVLRARRGARMAAITSGGAIPETANYNVVAEPEGTVVGNVDEDFAIESMSGDIFLLGTTSWLIRRVEAGVVRVENANGAPPSIPFWNGEGLGRTVELSAEVAALRRAIDERSDDAAIAWLIDACKLDRSGAEQAVAYVRAGKAALGALPTDTTLVAERFFDEAGGMQLVLHTPFGARINRAWGLALRKKFCRTFDIELQAAATDNGIVLSLSDGHAFPLDAVWEYVKPASVEQTLVQALLPAPMFAARWRWNATRSLAILRSRAGRKVAPQLQRMRAEDLLAACFPDAAACQENIAGPMRVPDHVLVRETIENCLYEAMDLEGLLRVLNGIESRAIRTVSVDTAAASPFSHEILNANPYAFLDDAPLEERRARAVTLRRTTRDETSPDGILDPAAIAEVAAQSWPVVRDADELHDALTTLVLVPPVDAWRPWFDELVVTGRATTLAPAGAGGAFWTCAERLAIARVAHPDASPSPEVATVRSSAPLPETRAAAFAEIVRGWLESSGPTTVADFAQRFAVDDATIEMALLQLENEGQVFSGAFTGGSVTEWINRRVLARIHRLTIGTLRREIEPVSTADYVRFLFRWQHVAPGTQLHGVDGTLAVIHQLEGFEIPAAAWEATILPARVARYRHEYLDKLCLAGDVMWGRLSPHASLAVRTDDAARRRVRPTKLAPIALFERADAATLLARAPYDDGALSHAARDVLAEIQKRGAPFFADIVRGSGRLPAEVEEALWQLVAAGLVTADGFDALRSLTDGKRRLGEKGLRARPRSSSGRWTALAPERAAVDVDAFARRLLARYGVVFRDAIVRESVAPPWRELLRAYRRLEARGEIRGGRFVAGYVGEQFALPDAIDALRAARRSSDPVDVDVSMHDPLAVTRRWMAPAHAAPNVAALPESSVRAI